MSRRRILSAIEAVRPRLGWGWAAVRRKAATSPRAQIESLEARQLLAANPIVAENQLTGTPQSVWGVNGVGDTTIQGFSTDISVDVGQTISFKINDSTKTPYHVDIYRMGYYQGNGARLVTTLPSSQTQDVVQPAPLTNATTGLIDCGNWSVTASWSVPSNAVSGIYMARPTKEDQTAGASLVYFVVRNDASHSQVLVQTSDSTWQAYNTYGGNSLYGGQSQSEDDLNNRAYAISYNRPLNDDAATGGLGDYNSPLHAEYPMVRWLERNGYDVTYFTDVDSARYGSLILNHQVFMSVGHDEYWSAQQRANVQAARDAGVNLAFFSGNESFWETRWGNSIDSSSTPYRTLICYKESYSPPLDPMDPSVWTGTYRDPRQPGGANPENALSGTMYMDDRTSTDIGISMTVPYADADLRFWRDTSVAQLQPGQTATLGDRIVGYETDSDVDNGFRPAGLMDMSSTTFNTQNMVTGANGGTVVAPGTSTHEITLYRAASGALVFGAGTVQWSWGLDGTHNDTPGTADINIQQATVNLLADMGVQPGTLQAGLKAESESTDLTPPKSTILTPAAGANLTAATTVTISGTAQDFGGGVVAGVEVSTDGGQTWHPATGRNSWTYSWVPSSPGTITILSRAVDDSGNLETPGPGVQVSVHYVPTSTAGLVAAYNFDQQSGTTLTDLSGSGNNGTISNATWVTNGRYGGALSFNGTNSIVTVANSSSLQLSSGMTLEAWVQPTSLAGWDAVIYKPRSANGLAYALYGSDGVSRPPSGYVNDGTASSSAADTAVVGTSLLPLNGWTNLAVTYDGSNLDLYVNDALVSSTPVSGSIISTTYPLTIGDDNIGEAFQGLIDNVRIYNRALSQTEIGLDMSQPVGGSLDSTPPSVSLSAPASGASVAGTVTLSANGSDNVGVAGIQFLLNGNPLGTEDTSAPYSIAWNTASLVNGTYVLSARARDFAGNFTTASSISVTVNNPPDTTPPTVTLDRPLVGSTIGGTVLLSAAASDNIGVTGVQFQVNGINVGPLLTTAPFRLFWQPGSSLTGPATITAIAYDAAGNAARANAAVTIDATPPTVTSFTPANGATSQVTSNPITVTYSESVIAATNSFVVKDSSGNVVNGQLTYVDSTHTVTFSPIGSLSPSTTYTVTVSGTEDLYGNAMASPVTWSFTTINAITGATIWSEAEGPVNPSVNDTSTLELGVKFQSDLAGYITGIRFYKGVQNTGTHTGHLWTSTGTLLGTVTFTNETTTGWEEADFSSPIPIAANTTYIASYFAPNGGYAADGGYFASGVDASPLHALADGVAGPNGVYVYGGGFPNQSYVQTNYWVQPVFSTINTGGGVNGGSGQDTPPTITSETPAPSTTGVPTAATIDFTFNESVQFGTISYSIQDSSGRTVSASLNYDDTTHTAVLTPSAGLKPSTTYTVTISGTQDALGTAMTAPVSWSFTTGTTAAVPPISIWSANSAPTVPASSDGSAVQVGVKFVSDVSGYVTGISFYKGAGNGGSHVGNLWTSDGKLLASATFTSETATGWQTVQFSSPVAIAGGTVYIASYYAPQGHYASDNNYFSTKAVDNGTIHALSNSEAGGNGVYAYGGASTFPSNTYSSTNYWVDLTFTPLASSTAPAVIAQSPAPNASGASVIAPVSVSFNEPVVPESVTFVLKDSHGNVVDTNWSYDYSTNVASITPDQPLAYGATYTATLSTAENTAGIGMTGGPVTWSFTTEPVVIGASLWSTSTTPAVASVNDTNAVELGVKFTADYAGYISGIRFYKGALNTGTHVGHLWASDGTLLSTLTFSNETATGWQFATFSSPIAIQAGATYVASYFAPNGGYAMDAGYFASSGTNNGPLHAASSSAAGGNGVFLYGASGGFPTGTYNGGNYWIDVVYNTVLDATPPAVTATLPAQGVASVSPTAAITATFSEAVQPGTYTFTLTDSGGNTVPATLGYNASTNTVTLTPSSPLASRTVYTATISGAKDLYGNVMTAPLTWSFTTEGYVLQTTAADFSTGTSSGATVTNDTGGEVQLAPAFRDDFAGSSLASAWTSTSWASAGGGPISLGLSNGVLSVAGGEVASSATYSNAAVEASVDFGAAPYQNFGLATGLSTESGNDWVMFGTGGTSTSLFARVNVGGALTEVNLGVLPTGFHHYLIQPISGGFQFYVDGVLATAINAASFPTSMPLTVVMSAFSGSPQPALQVDWVQVDSYPASGTFVSPVINAGQVVMWNSVNWDATVPAGTTLTIEVRGSSDGSTWTNWQTVTNGAAFGTPLTDQYIQYEVVMTTSNPSLTPVLTDVTLTSL